MPSQVNLFDKLLELVSTKMSKSSDEEAPPQPVQPVAPAPLPVRNIDYLVKREIKRIVEALLFATDEPITFNKLRDIVSTFCPVKPRLLTSLLDEMREEYYAEQRAFQLEEIPQGFILRSRDQYRPYIQQLNVNRRGEKLSHAASEILAIIAYRQPITRPEIDAIRGVDSSGTLASLLERGLIEISGRLEAPGRPSLYITTYRFLQHFGLKDLSELPQIQELRQK